MNERQISDRKLPRVSFLFLLFFLACCFCSLVDCKRSGSAASNAAASNAKQTSGKRSSSAQPAHHHRHHQHANDDDDDDDDDENDAPAPSGKHDHDEESIEDVDEDKIDDIVDDNEKNLVVIFYDTNNRCPQCRQALKVLEEIDDDLEASGYIEVVKSDDKKVAQELGVHVFPSLIYYRRKHPILYDGDFSDSETILKWIRAHEYIAAQDLDDHNFEEKTDTHSPAEGALDWFILFYSSQRVDCNAYVPVWETVAHRLKGIVHVGRVDVADSDDVANRFHIDDDDCPTVLFFRRGKMYRYKDTARDVKSFVNFALFKFKEQRAHKVPEPPTLIEGLYEEMKEEIQEKLGQHTNIVIAIAASLGVTIVLTFIVSAIRSFRSRGKSNDKSD